jgi:hypothetical protein
LYFFDLNSIGLGLTFYFFGLIGFWGSLVFYNYYLTEIAFTEKKDKIIEKWFVKSRQDVFINIDPAYNYCKILE